MRSYIVRRQQILLVIFIAILLITLLTSSACIGDPGTWIEVDNRTDQTLSIFIFEGHQGDVPPGEIKRIGNIQIHPDPEFSPADFKYLIEAKTEDGEVIYSEEFTWQELDDMDWAIVIPPSSE